MRLLEPADAALMLAIDRKSGALTTSSYAQLDSYLNPGDILVFNDTKVIKARVPLHNVLIEIPHHPSASKVLEEGEIFFLEMIDPYRFE